MWGDTVEGWADPALDWIGTLAAAGVPFGAHADPAADDGDGLLLLPDPEAWPSQAQQAADSGRPLVIGPPPEVHADRLRVIREALGALVRPDLDGVLVLRLDDPGASLREHLDGWRHPPVAQSAWDALWGTLSGFGRVSVFCCPGWVERDGLLVDSRSRDRDTWQALERGVAAGVADLECHGHTHLHPNRDAWLAAPDRFTNPDWYRELWPPLEPAEPDWRDQARIIGRWQSACGQGTALVAPGEGWGAGTLRAARERGLKLVNSWGICRLDFPTPTWSRGVGSPYLDEAGPEWFTAGLPVIGYWHERDMAVGGPAWAPEHLERWRDAGARRAWAFADLARSYETPIEAYLENGEVRVVRAPAVPLITEVAA